MYGLVDDLQDEMRERRKWRTAAIASWMLSGALVVITILVVLSK